MFLSRTYILLCDLEWDMLLLHHEGLVFSFLLLLMDTNFTSFSWVCNKNSFSLLLGLQLETSTQESTRLHAFHSFINLFICFWQVKNIEDIMVLILKPHYFFNIFSFIFIFLLRESSPFPVCHLCISITVNNNYY